MLPRACLFLVLATALPSWARPLAAVEPGSPARLPFAQLPDFTARAALLVTELPESDTPALRGAHERAWAALADPPPPMRPRGSRPFELVEQMPLSYAAAMACLGLGLVVTGLSLGYLTRRLSPYTVDLPADGSGHARPLPPFVIACPARTAVE